MESMMMITTSSLKCGSHMDRLLIKLPVYLRDSFIEHCLNKGILREGSRSTYALRDLAAWLEDKAGHTHVSFVMARSRVAPKSSCQCLG